MKPADEMRANAYQAEDGDRVWFGEPFEDGSLEVTRTANGSIRIMGSSNAIVIQPEAANVCTIKGGRQGPLRAPVVRRKDDPRGA